MHPLHSRLKKVQSCTCEGRVLYYFVILYTTDSLVHMEQDKGCICVEDSKENKVCTPIGCDGT